jgi:serine/threonine protein kinase
MRNLKESILEERYQVIDLTGTGGMAVVYKAYDTRLERQVALKVIRTDIISQEQQSRLLARFDREAKTQASLNHRHIVPIFDYGVFEGSPYLVLAFVPNGTLKEKAAGKVVWRQAIQWIMPIADALSYAHHRGIIHRDIKPNNILFDEENQPVLTDFGIAKILGAEDNRLTGTGQGVGTPDYMAPEQWRGKTSPLSDQYGLGVVLYELVTGVRPYQGDTPAALAIKQATEPLQHPGEYVPEMPDGLAELIMTALSHEPQDRYNNMDALHAALKDQLHGSRDQKTGDANQGKPSTTLSEADFPAGLSSEAETVDVYEKTADTDLEELQISSHIKGLKTEKAEKPFSVWMMWAGGSVLMICLLGIVVSLLVGYPGLLKNIKENNENSSDLILSEPAPENEEVTITVEQMDSTALANTAEPTISEEIAEEIEPTQEVELGIGSTMINKVDSAVMVYVPSGEFLMGAVDEDARENEGPERDIYLDSYWIYQTPVTNSQYRQCIMSGSCRGSLDYYLDNNYPAVQLHWNQASDYCKWADTRLPTEAEWEKAARGTDGRKYPWGDSLPDCTLANFKENNYEHCEDGVQEVGSYPLGASSYGVFDMVGSVSEWVFDWYEEDYYNRSPYENPSGPSSGEHRVVRGGNWQMPEWHQRTTYRGPGIVPSELIGFRCVQTP